MGLFSIRKPSSDGNNGGGILGHLIKMDEKNDVIVWKWPSDEIVKGAVIKVHQTQEALLYSSGVRIDHIGPGRSVVVDSANIPGLDKTLNVATGGETTYTFEVWFVNKTVIRQFKIGIGENDGVKCPMPNPVTGDMIQVSLQAHGSYQFGIYDGEKLCDCLVGTEASLNTARLGEFLENRIKSLFTGVLKKNIRERRLSVLDVIGSGQEFSAELCEQLNEKMLIDYGIEIKSVDLQFASKDYDRLNSSMSEGAGMAATIQQQGAFYDKAQQYDILRTAAANQGAGSAMGMGMGFGMGNTMGAMMGGMMGQVYPQTQPAQTSPAQAGAPGGGAPVPPPLPQERMWYMGIGGQTVGPLTANAIRSKIADGAVTPSTLVWSEGMAAWAEASTIPDLSRMFGAIPPPLPPM